MCFNLFQISDVSLQQYIAASAGGMLLCQVLYAYIGSTLRSVEEVVSSSSSSTAAYIVFGGQVHDCMFADLLRIVVCAILLATYTHNAVMTSRTNHQDMPFGITVIDTKT